MGFAWRWADVSNNPTWKGLTWGLLPLHSSGITACTYHLFYNQIPVMVPLQAFLTCVGNVTAAYAVFRIARYEGWKPELDGTLASWANKFLTTSGFDDGTDLEAKSDSTIREESSSLVGFEDLGNALKGDNDLSFVLKLFVGCAVASYGVKYGATFFDFPYDANVFLALGVVLIPSMLNAFKWYKRGQDPTFEGWF
jgi:Protein of unknown function (DUF2499)